MSIAWTVKYPNVLLLPMARTILDHIPFKVQIGTIIPKAQTLKFEKYWI
jgi:hypothetical protein